MIKELNDLAHFIKTSVWRDEALLAAFSDAEPELQQLYRQLEALDLAAGSAAARRLFS